MSTLIIIGLLIWAISAICKSASAKKAEKQRAKQIAQIKAEQSRHAQIMREYKQAQVEAKIEAQRVIALEREQMRQAKELEKHEAMLKKHDEEIAKLTFKVEQATADIEYITEQLGDLYALLDIAENQQMMAVPGSKADASAQNKVISLKNRIRTAERKLDKANFDKEQAERKLA